MELKTLNEGINTMIDPNELVWVARYKDGSIHTQYNGDGSYRDRYADIVRNELSAFELWAVEPNEQNPEEATPSKLVLRIHFDTPDKKLIYRRKVYKKPDGTEFFVYLAGWQIKTGDSRSVQSLNLVFPDGHVETGSKWDKNNPFWDQPTIHPWEGEDWRVDKEELTPEQIETIREKSPEVLED